MIKKILITGASGFIGSHLVEYLLKDGVSREKLRLFVHKGERLSNLPTGNFDIVFGDVRDAKAVKQAVRGVDTIYHLAAVTREGEGRYMDINYFGTKNLVTACKGKNVRKFVFFSTIAVFGLPAFIGDKVRISEETRKEVIGEYAESKDRAEKELLRAHDSWGLPYAIVRPTTVYGPRDKAGVYELFKAIDGGYFFRIGNGQNMVDYVYVGDVVAGARLAEKDRRREGDYILGATTPISFHKLVDAVARSLDKTVSEWYLSKPFALTLAHLLDGLGRVFGFRNILSADRVRVMTTNYYFSSEKARKEISYSPKVDIREGAMLTAQWYRQQKK